MAFFDRFRVELAKYDDGVHDVGEPADDAALRAHALPPGLADFYRSWNGVRLFADTIIVVPLDALAALPASAGVRLGEWPEGVLELGSDGRVRSRDEDGAAMVVGSSLEQFLAVAMAREGLLVERDGEFKDVFEEEGVEERVRDKQTKAALKIDPDAAAWHLESAERGRTRESFVFGLRFVQPPSARRELCHSSGWVLPNCHHAGPLRPRRVRPRRRLVVAADGRRTRPARSAQFSGGAAELRGRAAR